MNPGDIKTHLLAEAPYSIQMNDGRSIQIEVGDKIEGFTHYVVHEDKNEVVRVLAIRNISGFTMAKGRKRKSTGNRMRSFPA